MRTILIFRDAFNEYRWEYEHPDYGRISSRGFDSYGGCYDDASNWANSPIDIVTAPGTVRTLSDTTHEVITDDE